MSYNKDLLNNLNSCEEVNEPTPQYIIPPKEFNAYADRWNDILTNPPPPTKPTRPIAPAPTPASRDVEPEPEPSAQQLTQSTPNAGGNLKSGNYTNKASLSTFFYQPQFDDKELDYRLHCLAREKRLLYGTDPEDHEFISRFDVFEEFQSYFLPDDNYIWNENRRASRLCDQVTWGRLNRCPIRGVITDPQYLSFSSSAMNFGEGARRDDSRPGLYLSRRLPTETYRPPTKSNSLSYSERSTPSSKARSEVCVASLDSEN